MRKRNKKNNRKGFTLVETLVAISLLLVALVLPMSASYIGISQAIQARDRLIATYLAQDGIEYMRYVMATNIRGSKAPLQTYNNCEGPNWCSVDVLDDKEKNDEDLYLLLDSVTHEYGNKTGDPTLFQRAVRVTPNASNDEFQIEVRMRWGKITDRKELILKENVRTWLELI